jgi:hypothetical protein
MSDFTVKNDAVDVEQIMRQIRSRIRDKRGVDYTEEEIRELANVKLESFLDPRSVRSDLLQQFQARREQAIQNYAFEDTYIFESNRRVIAWIRKLLRPVLKLFFNPNPIIDALHRQSKMNEAFPLYFELIHNLVLETTRLSIEVKNLKMRVESMSSRLDFDERRARALEGVVQYRPGAVAPLQPPASPAETEAESAERRSRRRRRRRRRPDQRQGEAGGASAGAGDEGGAGDDRGTDSHEPGSDSTES